MSLTDIKTTEVPDGDDTILRYTPQTRRGGAWVRFGLEEFRIPALGLYEVQELDGDVKLLQGMEKGVAPSAEQWKAAHSIIWAAMRRNYPSIELKDVVPLVDLQNMQTVLGALFGISGYERRQVAPGESQPGQ